MEIEEEDRRTGRITRIKGEPTYLGKCRDRFIGFNLPSARYDNMDEAGGHNYTE